MTTINEISNLLDTLAPLELSEEWDNVGLLLGDREAEVERIMTCLTLTPDVAREAVEKEAGLVVSHHPILFRPVQRLTTDTPEGRMLLDLMAAKIAVYSPHTSYDSSAAGINQQLAELFDLLEIAPLREQAALDVDSASTGLGAGRFGRLPQAMSLAEFLQMVKQRLQLEYVQFVGDQQGTVETVGIACGSAAEFLPDAARCRCQVLVTGEGRFHNAFEAQGLGVSLVLVGHYASERPAVERLAELITAKSPRIVVWPSEVEVDPIQWA